MQEFVFRKKLIFIITIIVLNKLDMEHNYREVLSKIESVRNKLSEQKLSKLNLPQITVIGDQSSGKSSLLSEISGIPFPTSSGITTKCPIIVYTKFNSEIQDTKYYIQSDIKKEISKQNLCEEILELQRKNLGSNKVVKEPITIYAEGSERDDLVLVDLPGIISNGDGKNEVIDMIDEYITPKESLILIVTEAKQDDETAKALELARNVDEDGIRSIRILTKFDVFDSDESEMRAKNLIKNIDILSPHAVICCPKGKEYCHSFEKEKLSELPEKRAGIMSLKERLPALLCELIRTNLPGLEQQIDEEIRKNSDNLLKIGENPPDNHQILMNIQANFIDDIRDIEFLLTPSIMLFSDKIRDTRKLITEKVVNKFYQHNAFENIFFQGSRAIDKILKMLNDTWLEIINWYMSEVVKKIDILFDISKLSNISKRLKKIIEECWNEYRKQIYIDFNKCMINELKKYLNFHTMNHYLTSKYEEKLILPEEVINDILDNINQDTFLTMDHYSKKTVKDISDIRDSIREIIESEVERNIEEFNRKSIDEQHKQRIFAASTAIWSVHHKNFIDNINSTTQEILFCKIQNWKDILMQDIRIKENIGEDNTIKISREQYKKTIKVMNECKEILQE